MTDEQLLADLDRRFSVSGECRSIPLELASPPPPPSASPGVVLRDTYKVINLQRQAGLKPPGATVNPICRKTKAPHRFNRYSNQDGKYRLRCRDCCNTRVVSRETYEKFEPPTDRRRLTATVARSKALQILEQAEAERHQVAEQDAVSEAGE